MLNFWQVALSETDPLRTTCVFALRELLFLCDFIGGGYATHFFAGSFVDCNLFVGGGVFARRGINYSVVTFAGGDAGRLVTQTTGERLDDGSSDWQSSADWLSARLFAGSGNRRSAKSLSSRTHA